VQALSGWPDRVDPGRDFEAFGRHLAAFFTATAPGGDVDALATLREAPDRTQARQAWARYFENIDVFLCPIAPSTAPEHDDRPFTERSIETPNGTTPYSRVPFWIAHATLSGLPAAVVPVGTTASTGLPVAIQIIGPQHEDNTVLAFAEHLKLMIGTR
jgi:amidase